ncbi:hypothetical protein [Glutamicibacter mishrai]|uniref:hypothetical protein n=1 Tax=Glutamicibacter mishrai TaxID=1775880 RepID=UPI001C205E77|nr:hypothetical protein [Glutamicibacter mishrai]
MSINVKGRERPGLMLAAGTLLSSPGVVMAALVCCGVPVLAGAAGVFAAVGPATGNLWIIAAAALAAGVVLMQPRRRNSAEARAGGCALFLQSRPVAPAATDSGSKG